MASTFGEIFRVTTFGESHGGAVGVVIDGCPAGIHISLKRVQDWLTRRRPGQSQLTSPRDEKDVVECLSGLEDNLSLGSPITLIVRNKNVNKKDYEDMAKVIRPSHADFTTIAKYGVKASSGGGRSSARETIGRVAAAAVAEQLIEVKLKGLKVVAFVDSVKNIQMKVDRSKLYLRENVEKNPVRCPDETTSKQMENLILEAKKNGDSVGGTIFCGIYGCPPGLGEPVFDKFEAELAKAMMSLPATKGFEIGSGFSATKMLGSEHNDAFEIKDGEPRTVTNHSGGVQGGMTNGEIIYTRTAFKPVSTIFKTQKTITHDGEEVDYKPEKGRHDPCVLPRAVPMVEAMTLLVMVDMLLRSEAARVGGLRS